MDLNEYMDRDFELLRKRITDTAHAYNHQDPGATMTQAKEMFEAFSRRFAVEDFLLSKFTPDATMKPLLEHMLKKRKVVREKLEDMLMLHVSEPDFMKQVQELVKMAEAHLEFLQTEFHPKVIQRISDAEMKNMSNALEDRLHKLPL